MGEEEIDAFRKRMKDYMLKATREAKVNTSWISPNLPYEEGLLKFIDDILSLTHHWTFIRDFEDFQRKISYFGMFNSLSQTLLKITSPGAPDFYQGTELWDFSLVDPDNRRPVNFDIRTKMLKALEQKIAMHGPDLAGLARELLQEWGDGSIKLYVTFKSLNYRRENPQLFKEGDYTPLVSEGDFKEHVCAFARQREDKSVSVIVPRFLSGLIQDTEERPLGAQVWGNTGVVIPESMGKRFHNLFTNEVIKTVGENGKAMLPLSEIFANFPVALLEGNMDPGSSEKTP
jgi:(1->4)-alpha-D-glucan 1-alpha-D-glucosylmutase